MDFGRIRVKDLLLVDPSGEVIEGTGQVNRAAYAIHSAVHRARPDVVAAAHSHSLYGKAYSTLGRTLDAITQDHCDFYRDTRSTTVSAEWSSIVRKATTSPRRWVRP